MSRVEPGYFKIGVFVLTGLTLAVVGIAVFGAGVLFKNYASMETYFDESVQGLSEGSAVKYRGVQIGFVDEINYCRNKYELDEENPNVEKHARYVYVKVALYPSVFESFTEEEVQITLARLVDRGLRARLTNLGVTGTAYLEVDYLNTAINPKLDISWTPTNFYVPSAESTLLRLSDSISAILRDIEAVPFAKIGEDLDRLLVTVDNIATTVDFTEAQELLTATFTDFGAITTRVRNLLDDPELDSIPDDASELVARLREIIDQVGPEAGDALEAIRVAGGDVSAAAESVTGLFRSDDLNRTLVALPGAIGRLQRALKRIDELVAHEQFDIETILENVRLITDDVRELSTNVKRNPSQLLFGEPPKPKEKE